MKSYGCLNDYFAAVVRLVAAAPGRQLSVGQIAQQRPCPDELRQGCKYKQLLLGCPKLVLKGNKDIITVKPGSDAKPQVSTHAPSRYVPLHTRAIAEGGINSVQRLFDAFSKAAVAAPVHSDPRGKEHIDHTSARPNPLLSISPHTSSENSDHISARPNPLLSISPHTSSENKDDGAEIHQRLTSHPQLDFEFQYVDTPARLNFARRSLLQQSAKRRLVAFDCEGDLRHRDDNGKISLIQLSVEWQVWVLDVQLLDERQVLSILKAMFEDRNNIFLCHDVHADALALNSVLPMKPVTLLDAQLACEYITHKPFAGFNNMLELFGGQKHHLKMTTQANMNADPLFWKKRPLSRDALRYAALDVHLMMQVVDRMFETLGYSGARIVLNASMLRYSFASSRAKVARSIYFDPQIDYQLGSYELYLSNSKADDSINDETSDLQVVCDFDDLLALVPDEFKDEILGNQNGTDLIEIVLDKGKPPFARFRVHCVDLVSDASAVVTGNHLREIVTKIGEDRFGPDNRAGLDASLHRISAMRNKEDQIYALTMRVGRAFYGNANVIQDILFCPTYSSKSILVLGPPGSGKTTVIREIARKLASSNSVCVIDTSNEICGDGDVPHPCVGRARRMMVKHIDMQSNVMIECVQNHTPEVLIIDEIGRSQEVEAAGTCKQRGVRIIASAHGNLRSLVRNSQLNGLVGGVAAVTIGDRAAEKNHGNKIREQRETLPIFEIVVEVERGKFNEFTIIDDVAYAVDCILADKHVRTHKRMQEWEIRDGRQRQVFSMAFSERT